MRDLNKAMKKLQEAKRLESMKLAKLVKESVVEPEDKEEIFDNKFNYKVSLDNGKTITSTCSKENIEDARKYFLGKTYLNTKTGEKAKVVGVEEIEPSEDGFEEIKNEEFGSTAKELTDNDPAQKVPFDSEAEKDLEDAAKQEPKIVAEEFGSENKDLTDNDPAQKKAFETETTKEFDDATKKDKINDKVDESKKLNEATEEDINNENKLEKAKQLIEVIFNMESLDETRRAAKQELKDLVYPQRIEPEKTEKKIVKESIFDNDEETKVKEDRLASLRTQLEQDGDQLADDEKEAIQAEIDSLENDLYESKQLNEGTKGKTLEIIYTNKDGEEKTTHFECDKDYELDGEQIREAIKSSDNDIVDIIKIVESCQNEGIQEPLNEEDCDDCSDECSIENIDDETFTESLTKFVKENYKNAKEFKLENVIKSGNKYKFECKLTFNSGKEVKVDLMSEAVIKEGKSLIRFYENKTFKHLDENKSIMTAAVNLKNKTLSCEGLRYNYKVALKENKIATIRGIIK